MIELYSEKLKEEFEKIRSERQSDYQERGVVLDDSAFDLETGFCLKQATINAACSRKNYGQAVLEGLWLVFWNNYHRDIDEIDTLDEWADTHLSIYISRSYLMDLVRIVTQVFPAILKWDEEGKPLKDENGEIIDIPYLINKVPISSLKAINEFFSERFRKNAEEKSTVLSNLSVESESAPAHPEELQRTAVVAATNRTRDDVLKLKEEIKNGNPIQPLPTRIIRKENGRIDLFIENITVDQFLIYKKIMGEMYREICDDMQKMQEIV